MISIDNYFVEISKVIIDNLPDTLKKGHQFLEKATDNGTTWDDYYGNETVRKVIDLYLDKLNQYLASVRTEPRPSTHVRKTKNEKQEKPERKDVTKRTLPKPKKPRGEKNSKKVEHIREEVKFISRYVRLHNKIKSPYSILSFIKSLQRAIIQKLIRKTSPYAKEIRMIQDKLVKAYNKAKGKDIKLEINQDDLPKLVAIAGGEGVYPSINIMKRYIGMQGKVFESKRIETFIKHIEGVLANKKVSNDDPYYDKVKMIFNSIKKLREGNFVHISQSELNGLEGIVNDCQCKSSLGKIYNTGGKRLRPCKQKTYTDSKSKGACSHNSGLSGVLTAEEMANRHFEYLDFAHPWKSLFGRPAKNFSLMFHGEPGAGKTTLLLKFAEYLANNFGRVLYVSSEEHEASTLTEKINELLNPIPAQLEFAPDLETPDLSNYNFIILDSVNDLGLKLDDFKALRKEHPGTAFLLVLQHTKGGDYRGGKDWEHDIQIAAKVEDGNVSVYRSRYGVKGSLDFFSHFTQKHYSKQ